MPIDELRPQTCQPIVFFAAVQYGDLLAGRTRRLSELLIQRGHPVAFVEMPSVRAAARRLGGTATPTRAHLTVLRLPPLPGWTRLSETVAGRAWNALAARLLRGRLPRLAGAIAIVSTPWWLPILRGLSIGCLVYDFVDHVAVHAGVAHRERFERWEEELLRRSDLVSTVSPRLREHAVAVLADPRRVVHIANGVPGAWLQAPPTVAAPLLALPPGPRVGFVGALFEWIDFDLLVATARQLADHQFIFAGPLRFGMPAKELLSLPNVHHFAGVPFDEVPRWLAGFDACLIPFKQGAVSDCADPIKLYEYCAAGKPVVSTIDFAVPGGPAPLQVAIGAEAFAQAIREVIARDDAEAGRQRRDFARRHTWDLRVDALLAAAQACRKRPGPGSADGAPAQETGPCRA